MDFLVMVVVAFLALALLASLVGAFFMWIGAKLAGVRKASFWRSISAASGASFATWSMALLASVMPGIGTAAGFGLGALVSMLIIKSAYDTTFEKAILVWLFDMLAEAISLAASLVLFAGVVLTLLHH